MLRSSPRAAARIARNPRLERRHPCRQGCRRSQGTTERLPACALRFARLWTGVFTRLLLYDSRPGTAAPPVHMKRHLSLLLSLAANAVLVALLISRPHPSPSPVAPASTQPPAG